MSAGKLTGKVTTETARGLTIRTPTATVIDLGTEFGVTVDGSGETTAHVFRGSIRVQATAAGATRDAAKVLRKGQSARVGKGVDERAVIILSSTSPANFVREIPKSTTRTFDLVDVVAGGDGFSGRRGRGIDPTNGQPAATTLKDMNLKNHGPIVGNGKYHRVETSSLIDGVFIPDSHFGSVQVDSAGHMFAEFGKADGMVGQNIWAGGVIPVPTAAMPPSIAALLKSLPPSQTLAPTKLGGIDYAEPGHGLIFLHANSGITFDLGGNPASKSRRQAAAFPRHGGQRGTGLRKSDGGSVCRPVGAGRWPSAFPTPRNQWMQRRLSNFVSRSPKATVS